MSYAHILDSSSIQALRYHPTVKTLEIMFRHGGTYAYLGVSQATYQAFVSASSAGRFFLRHIKGRYPCESIENFDIVA